jgi:hypothetical protein
MTRAAAVLWLGLAATGAMASDLPKLRTPVMADRPVLRPKVPIRSAPPIGSVSPDAGAWHTFVRLTASGLANAEGIRVVWFPGDDDSRPQAGAITATMRGRTAPDQVEIEIPADAGGPRGGVVRILAIMPKAPKPVFVARFTVGEAASTAAPAQPRVITTAKIEISGPSTKVIRTAAIQITGPSTKVIRTAAIQITGPSTKVIRTAAIQITGPSTRVIRTMQIEITGVH